MAVQASKTELIDKFRQLKAAYQMTFSGAHGELVLSDLTKFCHVYSCCFDADARIHAFNEGKRYVYLRIQDFLIMQPEAMAEVAIGLGESVPEAGDHDDGR